MVLAIEKNVRELIGKLRENPRTLLKWFGNGGSAEPNMEPHFCGVASSPGSIVVGNVNLATAKPLLSGLL